MHLSINSTTGGLLELSVPPGETIEGLTTCVSHRLGLSRDRIAILHKDRQLNTGKLLDQGVSDGSKLTLVPNVEAGLTNSRTDRRSMMQALESLTEAQISDFLSGRSPLTLALGIGTHVMYVQLQLAAQSVPGGEQQKPHGGTTKTAHATNTAHPPSPPETTHLSSCAPAAAATPDPLPCSRTSPVTPDGQPCPPPSTPCQLPSSNRTPVICQRPSRSVHHTSSSSSSFSSPLPSPPPGSSPPSSPCLPVPASAPCCPSPHPAGSNPGHQSPAPASTFPENSPGSSPSAPGAVIESFVNHSPGVFSGTFSGTLPPVSQTSVCHPRRGIAVILQILSDLLSATRHHQGAPNTLSTQLHCSAAAPGFSASPPPPPAALSPEEEDPPKTTSGPPLSQRAEGLLHHNKPTVVEEGHRPQQPPPTKENVTLRCKLEQLQSRLHQRRVRRHQRCCGPAPHHHHHPTSSHLTPSPGPHPYLHHLHQQPHSLLHSPGRQRSAREEGGATTTPSTSIITSSPDDMKMEVTEEEEEEGSPWKEELTSDLVVASGGKSTQLLYLSKSINTAM